MNCEEMKSRLTGLPGGFREEEFHDSERAHLESCPECRDLASHEQVLRARIAEAGRVAPPGSPYWGTILPRVRTRAARRLTPDAVAGWFGPSRFVVQGAGLTLLVLFLLMVNVTAPPAPGPLVAMASLSETELQDLRSSVRYTGLLDHSVDPAGGNGSTIVEFLAELFADDEGGELTASVNPLVVLGEVDDASFGEIVDILNSKK
jgi:hypothetical protein